MNAQRLWRPLRVSWRRQPQHGILALQANALRMQRHSVVVTAPLRHLSSAANGAVRKKAHPITSSSSSEWKTQLANGPELQDFIARSAGDARANAEEDAGEECKLTTEESLEQIRLMLRQIKQAVRPTATM